MKYFMFAFLFIMQFSANAQSVDDAYKREKGFLRSQKEALVKIKSNITNGFATRKAKAERDLLKMQTELSQLELKNQELVRSIKL